MSKRVAPAPGATYFYDYDKIWLASTHQPCEMDALPLPEGRIVSNLTFIDGTYTFNLEGDSRLFTCYYAWAFVLNTPENLQQLIRCKDAQAERRRQDLAVIAEFAKLQTLHKDDEADEGIQDLEA